MTTDDDYILGTDKLEIQRLGFQHDVWRSAAFALWERVGFCAGQTVIDLGSGPGFTSFDLATLVGYDGRIVAQDQNAGFLGFLTEESGRRGLTQIETHHCRVEELDLPVESLDGAYARWLFCWLEEPGVAMDRVVRALRPRGVIALQEYLDWSTLALFPHSEIVDQVVTACMQSWLEGGGTINIARQLPTIGADCGLRVEHFRPLARIGKVGSMEWRWIGGFFASYLPRLVERNLLSEDEFAALTAEWEARTAEGSSYLQTPTMADVVLRKP